MRRRLSLVLVMSTIVTFTCGLAMGLISLSGCSDGRDKNSAGTDQASSSDDSNRGSSVKNDGRTDFGSTVAQDGPYVDKDGRKFIAPGFPLDALIWFPDPLAVAAQEGNKPAGGGDDPSPTDPPKENDPPPMTVSSGDGPNWKDVVAADLIDNEMKKIANRFRAKLQNRASFFKSYLELPPHMATMAALAAIGHEHPDDIRWKKNAKHIRDLSSAMLSEELRRDPKSYKRVNDPFLQINDILSGSPATDLPDPQEGNDLSEFAEMGMLMKRCKVGMRWLQVNVGTTDALKENGDDIKHEAGLLALLVTAISTDSYGFGTDDEQFLGFAKEMVDGCRKIADAVESENLDNYQLGFSQVDQACSKCHNKYR
jgi:hypothetical protein